MIKMIVIVFSVKSSFMFENTTSSLEECIYGVEAIYKDVVEKKVKGASFQCVVNDSNVEYEKFYNVEFYPPEKK